MQNITEQSSKRKTPTLPNAKQILANINVCHSRGESKTKFAVNINNIITSTIYVKKPLLNRVMHHITPQKNFLIMYPVNKILKNICIYNYSTIAILWHYAKTSSVPLLRLGHTS